MTLMLPHLLDVLEGRVAATFIIPEESKIMVPEFLAMVKDPNVEKFDFGSLHLEPSGEISEVGSIIWLAPRLTADEKSFLSEGLIPLPSKVCWYEFVLGRCRSGFLVDGTKTFWRVMRADFDPGTKRGCFDGCWVQFDISVGRMKIVGPQKLLKAMAQVAVEVQWGSNLTLAEYMTLMLGSKTTEVRHELAPVRLNKARRSKGYEPLPDHRVVTIVPIRYIDRSQGDSENGRRSPRLHWRRSHARVLNRGESNEKRIIIPRFLVGKAELGEVSHEYVVKYRDDNIIKEKV